VTTLVMTKSADQATPIVARSAAAGTHPVVNPVTAMDSFFVLRLIRVLAGEALRLAPTDS
jgi:hypothetical protein